MPSRCNVCYIYPPEPGTHRCSECSGGRSATSEENAEAEREVTSRSTEWRRQRQRENYAENKKERKGGRKRKYTDEQVREVRRLRALGIPIREVSERTGVTHDSVYAIVTYKMYWDVE